jgi:hypothetical protein
MSKTSAKSHRKKKAPARRETGSTTSDLSIYIGLIMIGGAIVIGASLLTEGQHWREVALAYLILMAFLVNLYAFGAYQGKRMANWQQAMARLSLRWAGYGTKHGKPLTAAHNARAARKMFIISLVVSVLILIALAFLLIPPLTSAVFG